MASVAGCISCTDSDDVAQPALTHSSFLLMLWENLCLNQSIQVCFMLFSHSRLRELLLWSSAPERGIKTARVRGSHPTGVTRTEQGNQRVIIMSNVPSAFSTATMCVPWSKAVNPQISTVENCVIIVGSTQVGICKFERIWVRNGYRESLVDTCTVK